MTIAAASLLQAAHHAASAQHYPTGALYLVATPIGNLADISLRAAHVLGLVDAVACEDTRVSARLLQHLGLSKRLLAVHEHNEATAAAGVIEALARGERVAYVSDAGTPAVSDPGAVLVRVVREAGYRAVPIPGASSVVVALSAAGDEGSQGFHFAGFLPAKGATRAAALQQVLALPCSVVVFEAPHRVAALANDLARAAPQRRITLCRELTKQHESIDTLSAGQWPEWLASDPHRERGEFVIVLHAPAPSTVSDAAVPEAVLALLHALLAHTPLKSAVALVAEATQASRNALYEHALAWRRTRDASEAGEA